MKLGILAPFDTVTQDLLRELDIACGVQTSIIKKEMELASLAGKPFEVNVETMVWLKFIKGYGVLYNRAIDAGWVDGVMTKTGLRDG